MSGVPVVHFNMLPNRTPLPSNGSNAYYSTLGLHEGTAANGIFGIFRFTKHPRTPIRYARVTTQGVPHWTPAFAVSHTQPPVVAPVVASPSMEKTCWALAASFSDHAVNAIFGDQLFSALWNLDRWRSWVAKLTFASRSKLGLGQAKATNPKILKRVKDDTRCTGYTLKVQHDMQISAYQRPMVLAFNAKASDQ